MTTWRQPRRFTKPHVSSGSDEVPTCDNLYIKQLGKGDIGDARPLGSGRLGCLGRHSGETSQKQLGSDYPGGQRGRLGRHSVTRVTGVTHRDWVTGDAPPCQPTRPGMRLPRGRASQAAQVAEPLRSGQLLDALAAGWPSRRLNQESSLKHLLITAIRHKRENPHETAPNSPADSRPLRAFSARHQVEVTTHA